MQAFIDKLFDLTVRAGLPVGDLDTNILNCCGVRHLTQQRATPQNG